MAVLRGWSKTGESCFEGEMREEITISLHKLSCSSSSSHGIRKFRHFKKKDVVNGKRAFWKDFSGRHWKNHNLITPRRTEIDWKQHGAFQLLPRQQQGLNCSSCLAFADTCELVSEAAWGKCIPHSQRNTETLPFILHIQTNFLVEQGVVPKAFSKDYINSW